MITDLTTATPVEIDKQIVRLTNTAARHQGIADNPHVDDARRVEAAAALVAALQELAPLEATYAERRWTRWWFVPGGHLHREGDCSTLYPSTELVLTPPASGGDDDKVIELYGWRVCTVCVPAALVNPAARTEGSQIRAEADASGDCADKTPARIDERRRDIWGTCGTCGATGIPVTRLGNLKKHKHAQKLADTERAARIGDPKLIGAPDGNELRVDGWVIKTRRSAEIEYVRHAENADPRGWAASDDFRVEQGRFARQIAEALAAKDGVTVEEMVARLQSKVDAKIRKYNR